MRATVLWLTLVLLGGCVGRPDGETHVRELSKWHHQIAADGIVLDGYVLDSFQKQGVEYIAVALGHPYTCDQGAGDRLVLDEKITLVIVQGDSITSQRSWPDSEFSSARGPGTERQVDLDFSRMKAKLPMLFDSTGCRKDQRAAGGGAWPLQTEKPSPADAM